MSKEDYYTTLGVEKNANADTIKKAYRRMAMKYHPDRNKGDSNAEKKFKQVNEAYSILSDEQKRQTYDQFGHAGFDGAGAGAGAGPQGFDFTQDIFGKIFEEFAGGNPFQQSSQKRGSDLGYQTTITLEEAIQGVEKTIQYSALAKCESCNGKGGKNVITCDYCQGHGQVRMQQGFISIQQTCPKCQGEGVIIKDPCTTCHGKKRVNKQKKVAIKIPAGVDTGNRIRLSNEGEAGIDGGPNGDLYVEINVKEHDIFIRKNNDLHCEIPISFTQACLGSTIKAPTINGEVELNIPSETQTGASFRLRGKGVKGLRSHYAGDIICKIHVEIPVKLKKEQISILKEFEKSIAADKDRHNPRVNSWFTKIKSFVQNLGS